MPPPDYTPQLKAIITALNYAGEGKSASDLIAEVRNALTGPGGTVRDALLDLKQTIVQQFHDLMDQMRNAPAAGSGGGHGGMPGHADPNNTQSPINQVLAKFGEIGEKLERVLVVFEEGGSGQGGGGPSGLFNRQTYLRTYQSTQQLFDDLDKYRLRMHAITETFSDLKTQQFNSNFEELSNRVMNAALRTSNLGVAFERLTQSVSQNVLSYRENIFGSNLLSPNQYFFEFFNRFKEGILADSDSFRVAVQTVKDSLERGIASPLAMTGKSAAELASDFNLARQAISKQTNLRAFGTTEQTERWMVDLTDTMQKFGQHSMLNEPVFNQALATQTAQLAKIASNTGLSVDQLEKMVKQSVDQQAILVGLGRLRPEELDRFTKAEGQFKGQYGQEGVTLFELYKKALAGGRPDDRTSVIASDPEFWTRFAQVPGALEGVLQSLQLVLRGQTDQAREVISGLKPALAEVFQSQGSSGFMQGKMFGPATNALGGFALMANRAGLHPEASAAQAANAEPNATAAIIERVFSAWKNQISPLFAGIDFSLIASTTALGLNTAAIWILIGKISGIAGLGNIGGGGMLGAAGRIGGPILGGLGAAAGAYAAGSSGAGIAGAGLGGTLGGIGGAALGTAIAPGVGTVVGGMLGSAIVGYLGEKLGDWVSPAAAAPAVGAPQNVAGPVAQAVSAAVQPQISGQDRQVMLLDGLLNANVDGNNTLGQIYSELARQTGYLTGTPSTSSVPNMGRGLSVSAPAAANAGRPDASTPYAGPGF